MSNVPDNLELMIVRHLDSELTQEQELELNRELIRNPQAQQMLADYRKADELAVTALNQLIPQEGAPMVGTPGTATASPRRVGYYRAWWVLPGAVAAAILALVIPRPSVDPTDTAPVSIAQPRPVRLEGHLNSRQSSPRDVMRNVSTYPGGTRIKRNTGREVFGVVGDDGSVYWIQVDRIRTTRRPRRPASEWSPREAM